MNHITFAGSLIIVCAGDLAHADRQVAVTAGIGINSTRFPDAGSIETDDTPDPALRLDVGYRVEKHVAVGLHLGLSHGAGREFVFEGRDSYYNDITYNPLELGLGVQLGFGRFSVAPWIGLIDLGQRDNDYIDFGRDLAVGLAAGYDLIVRPDRHRFGLYGSVATDRSELSSIRMISIGAAYHYW